VLRHTFCSHLAGQGAPAIAIKELAGHSSIAVTNRYMHTTKDAQRAAIALLEAVG
jgi:site-specific recombinase XerD